MTFATGVIVLAEELAIPVSTDVRVRTLVVVGAACGWRLGVTCAMGARQHKVTDARTTETAGITVDEDEVILSIHDVELQRRAIPTVTGVRADDAFGCA